MAAIVNYRDLLLQGAATRFIPPSAGFDPSTLGDLALLDQVNTPQIAPGSITAGSGIVAPGAILTQALAPNAASITKSYYNAGPTTIGTNISGGAPEVVVATLPTFGSKGGQILISFGMRTSNSTTVGIEPANNVSGNQLVVRRNGFVIYTLNEIDVGIINIPPVFDTPGNGTPVSYTISIIPFNFYSTEGPTAWLCNERSAYLLESIK
jgi:hypothetical protein